MRELVRVARDFDFDNILIFEHFCDAIVNVDRVVDKIVAKKTRKTSNSKNKNSVFCLVVNDSNNDDNNDNNNDNDDFFFRLWLIRFNERMTTIYVANAASNNRLIVVMKDVNVLKRVELLKMTMSIEIVVDRKKTIEKKKQKKDEKESENDKTKIVWCYRHDATLIYFCERVDLSWENEEWWWWKCEMSRIESNLYREYFEKKTKWNHSNFYII